MGRRSDIDWQAIERLYRIGQYSVREIARKHEVAPSSISRRAKKEGWVQDATQEVRARTRAALLKSNNERNRKRNAPTRDDIDRAVQTNVEVITLHRKDINKLRELENKLLTELGGEPTKLYLSQYQGQIVSKTVALTVTERAGALRDLSTVQHKRIQLERQAYSLDDNGRNDNDGGATAQSVIDPVLEEMIQIVKDMVKRDAE